MRPFDIPIHTEISAVIAFTSIESVNSSFLKVRRIHKYLAQIKINPRLEIHR